ncbi:hypothetical protein [uncultured Desulfosarcina sp.]|uniref:hypothetical protein n=1 Tax=uncultured Desulfosarcina sp. TaxID=218289 RepID=UPI0029C836EE|nr:hypothetical protein [uncultured Desulfosarcina sp.]
MILARLKPDVPKCWLFAACGVLWSVVGLSMCLAAMNWLSFEGFVRGIELELVGLVVAVAALQWGFSGIARRNICRLRQLSDKGCFFAFQAWKSYLIIAFMIALGIMLRRSPIPRAALAVVYTAIGAALFLASFHYYRHLLRLLRTANRQNERSRKSRNGN